MSNLNKSNQIIASSLSERISKEKSTSIKRVRVKKVALFGFIFMILVTNLNCKKLVDVNPPVTSLTNASVFTTDATAIAAVTDMYVNIINSNFPGGINSMSVLSGLSADELTLYSGVNNTTYIGYYQNALTNLNTAGYDFWTDFYQAIFIANSAIQGLNSSTGLTPSIKQQLLGESEFMRAFYYFYLVNLYGDVPLVLTTNYKVNAVIAKTPQAQVWQQIIGDLKDAEEILSPNYLDGGLLTTTTSRIRPTRWAADALLARTYLYMGDWSDAEAEADSVINNSGLYSLESLNDVFLANSNEAIWQLQPTKTGQNTPDAWLFILPTSGPSSSYPVYLSENLLNSFELGDQRRTGGNWVDSIIASGKTYYYPYKYKSAKKNDPVTEYEMVLRLGEQYLIRAEARVRQGNTLGATADLNSIRVRAGLDSAKASSQADLLTSILHERQVELFTEWGHRWLDLKRTDSVDGVMGTPGGGVCAAKGGKWNSDWQWYPILLSELQADPNLIQNEGY